VATGSRTTCVVDDREADNPGRVVDMSPSGVSQIAALSEGVVTVSVSW
jgi:rare lipoprotein A (peptidoglycan hydrolase)